MRERRFHVRVGERVTLETPLAKVTVEPKGDVESIEVAPNPSDPRLPSERVLLANVMDRRKTVRLYALDVPADAATVGALPELVREEREDLVRRVLRARYREEPAEAFVRTVAQRVKW